jgi:hypothetical protein
MLLAPDCDADSLQSVCQFVNMHGGWTLARPNGMRHCDADAGIADTIKDN